MRRLLFSAFAVCQIAAAANAASICASPAELKVLQAAALQQQLMSASLSCHDVADYKRFVAVFRDRLVQSDYALKQFFLSRKNSEGYTAYKNRIAGDVSVRSLHDSRFCENAKIVFDMALKGGGPAHAPSQVQSGYERCRLAAPKSIVASNIPPVASLAVPFPAPRKTRAAAGVVTAVVRPVLSQPAIASRRAPERVEPAHPEVGGTPPRIASAESDHDFAESDEAADDNIPNAYKPGAHWVHDEPDAADDGPPSGGAHHARPAVRMVLGPGGRWHAVVRSRPDWSDD